MQRKKSFLFYIIFIIKYYYLLCNNIIPTQSQFSPPKQLISNTMKYFCFCSLVLFLILKKLFFLSYFWVLTFFWSVTPVTLPHMPHPSTPPTPTETPTQPTPVNQVTLTTPPPFILQTLSPSLLTSLITFLWQLHRPLPCHHRENCLIIPLHQASLLFSSLLWWQQQFWQWQWWQQSWRRGWQGQLRLWRPPPPIPPDYLSHSIV